MTISHHHHLRRASARHVELTVNGISRTAPDPDFILLDWIRTLPGCAGSKEGCAEGDCGACSVLLGPPGGGAPLPANACLLTVGQTAGLSITTVEGLGDRRDPHPLQTEIARSGGTQCGFCTPGFVVAGAALINRNPQPTIDDVHDALAGNLCRCTGYRAIVEAVRAAAVTGPQLPAAAPAHAPDDLQTIQLPRHLASAIRLASERPNARFIAGGTDLVLERRQGRAPTTELISLARVEEIARVGTEDGFLVIGGACPIETLLPEIENRWPSFGRILRRFGSVQIRSQATLGGNLATASPIGDAAPCLIALDATVDVAGPDGERTVAAADFITGYRRSALAPGEIVARIRVPEPPPGSAFRAWKVSKRYDQDISTLSAAFRIDRDGVARVAFGGMADRPLRCAEAEAALAARDFERAAEAVADEFAPIDDVRGSAAYRRLAAAGLIRRLGIDLAGVGPVDVMEL